MSKPRIIYVQDAMCGWCYAFGRVMDEMQLKGQPSLNPLVKKYLDSCSFFGVSSTSFAKEFGEASASNPEVAKEIARREQETADRARAANPGVYASADRQGFTDGKGGGFGSKSTGTNDAFSNKSGRGRTGYSEGGLATMFTRRR